MKEIIGKWLRETTAHGIPNLMKTEKISIKIMWLICVLISTGLCSYIIITNINSYFTYEAVTKIREINEFPSIFPTISICNTNVFTNQNSSIEFLKKDNENRHI